MPRAKSGTEKPNITAEAFGNRLRAIRTKKNIPVQEIADKVGCQRNFIFQLETGQKFPSFDTLIRLIEALDVSADELLSDYVGKRGYSIIDSELVTLLDTLPEETRFHIEQHIRLEASLIEKQQHRQA
ncbi:MAG: helix-turn-helix domain-containing protein [Eubacteriales bacterium]